MNDTIDQIAADVLMLELDNKHSYSTFMLHTMAQAVIGSHPDDKKFNLKKLRRWVAFAKKRIHLIALVDETPEETMKAQAAAWESINDVHK